MQAAGNASVRGYPADIACINKFKHNHRELDAPVDRREVGSNLGLGAGRGPGVIGLARSAIPVQSVGCGNGTGEGGLATVILLLPDAGRPAEAGRGPTDVTLLLRRVPEAALEVARLCLHRAP